VSTAKSDDDDDDDDNHNSDNDDNKHMFKIQQLTSEAVSGTAGRRPGWGAASCSIISTRLSLRPQEHSDCINSTATAMAMASF